jgi:uncharacterized protein (DUF433 family)
MSAEKKARLNQIVSIDPDLMHGAPCFRGTRVPVVSRELVEEYLELAQDLVSCRVARWIRYALLDPEKV